VSVPVLALVGLQAVNFVLFAVLAVRMTHVYTTTKSQPLRQISVAYLALCPVMLIRVALAAVDITTVELGLVEGGRRLPLTDSMLWMALVEGATTVAGALGLWSIRVAYRDIEHGEHVVSTLTNRVPAEANLRRAGLTSREWEVADLLGEGVLSDEEIADHLHIAPSTAGTHVRNILRKSGLNDRRQLMLLRLREPRKMPEYERD
jgi:DNA-binding CsgD family transcriptional regulator